MLAAPERADGEVQPPAKADVGRGHAKVRCQVHEGVVGVVQVVLVLLGADPLAKAHISKTEFLLELFGRDAGALAVVFQPLARHPVHLGRRKWRGLGGQRQRRLFFDDVLRVVRTMAQLQEFARGAAPDASLAEGVAVAVHQRAGGFVEKRTAAHVGVWRHRLGAHLGQEIGIHPFRGRLCHRLGAVQHLQHRLHLLDVAAGRLLQHGNAVRRIALPAVALDFFSARVAGAFEHVLEAVRLLLARTVAHGAVPAVAFHQPLLEGLCAGAHLRDVQRPAGRGAFGQVRREQ